MTKLLKLFLCGNGYCVINPIRSKVKRLTTKGECLKSLPPVESYGRVTAHSPNVQSD